MQDSVPDWKWDEGQREEGTNNVTQILILGTGVVTVSLTKPSRCGEEGNELAAEVSANHTDRNIPETIGHS